MKTSFADILREFSTENARKMDAKVPSWAGVEGLCYPEKLCTEQCSGEAAAQYKAGVAVRAFVRMKERAGTRHAEECGLPRLADLTGGLGVDSWAFSKVCSEVLYNEMNPALAEAVRSNHALLGAGNIQHSCRELAQGGVKDLLGNFAPDIIYLDPARRSDVGRKVFMLEDCRPDILRLKDELLKCAPLLMVKLSPMADITLLARQLGPCVREIHVVGAGGECKELLVVMDRKAHVKYRIVVAEAEKFLRAVADTDTDADAGAGAATIEFTTAEEAKAIAKLSDGHLARLCLFEPGKALLKSGAFSLLCQRYGLSKLGASTHLYICDKQASGAAESITAHDEKQRATMPNPLEALATFGKWFAIESVLTLDKRSMKEIGSLYPYADVTARNIPMTSEQLRIRMGISCSKGNAHIFGVHCDSINGNILLVTRRLQEHA